jgi:hypothetical protein
VTKPRIDLGRKGMHDPVIRSRIIGMVKAGAGLTTAARACGVSASTVTRWLRDGEAAMVRHEDDDGPLSPAGEFARDYALAIGEMQGIMLARIASEAESDWKAAAWILERRTPGDYGPRQVVAVDTSGDVDQRDVDAILSRVEAAVAKSKGAPSE